MKPLFVLHPTSNIFVPPILFIRVSIHSFKKRSATDKVLLSLSHCSNNIVKITLAFKQLFSKSLKKLGPITQGVRCISNELARVFDMFC